MLSNQRSQYLLIPAEGATDQFGTYSGMQLGVNILTAPIYMGKGLESRIILTKANIAQEADITIFGKDILGKDFEFDLYSAGASNGTIGNSWISTINQIVVNTAPAAGFSLGAASSRGYMQCEGNHSSHMVMISGGGGTWTMKGATFEQGESVQTGGGTPENSTLAFFPIAADLTAQSAPMTYLRDMTIPLGMFRLEPNETPAESSLTWYMGQKVYR